MSKTLPQLNNFVSLRHKATGRTAIGQRCPRGLVYVQFDDSRLEQSSGWHLYNIRDFKPRRSKHWRGN